MLETAKLETTQLQPSEPLNPTPTIPPVAVAPIVAPGRSLSQPMAEFARAGSREEAKIETELPSSGGSVQDAAALLGAFQLESRQRATQIARADDSKYQYYVRCRRHDQPGIYLRKNPNGGLISNADWFATYKGINEPWSRDIWCQHCLQYDPVKDEYHGEQFPLAGIIYVPTRSAKNVTFGVESRYLFRYPKDKELFEQMAAKGNALHRGVRMAADAMNHGLPADVVTREVHRAAG